MLKCVGVRRKQGENDSLKWDSVRFSLINDKAPETEGMHVESVKINKDLYSTITGRRYEDYREYIDKYVRLEYWDDGGTHKIASFTIIPDEELPMNLRAKAQGDQNQQVKK